MKFAIADVFWTVTATAILFAMLRYGAGAFILAFALLNLLQIMLPVAVVVATIAFADQRGSMLDVASLPGWQPLKKVWVLSMFCTVVVWALLFLS